MKKTRLDAELARRGLFTDARAAQAAIMEGKISVNGRTESTAGFPVTEADRLEIAGEKCPFVSRGGIKLRAALDAFGVNPAGKICLDVGVSTGGFADCFLQAGADKVYGVDVGKGTLASEVAANPRFVFFPNTNAKNLPPDMFDPKPELAAIDVSFISLQKILVPVINAMGDRADIIALIKPQFELEPKFVPGGIVADEAKRQEAAAILRAWLAARAMPVKDAGIIDCPLKGTKGNTEFLWLIKKG